MIGDKEVCASLFGENKIALNIGPTEFDRGLASRKHLFSSLLGLVWLLELKQPIYEIFRTGFRGPKKYKGNL